MHPYDHGIHMIMDVLGPYLNATMRTATPLALAALGELIVERAGIINIGLEGVLITGAFAAAVAAPMIGVPGAFAFAVVCGVLCTAVLGVFVIELRADQIVTGTALTLVALGTTGLLYRVLFGAAGVALTLPTARPVTVPLLARIPVFGPAAFDQPVTTYTLYALIPLLAWGLSHTHIGLALRAVGEDPGAVAASGMSPRYLRWLAVLVAGALGGISGATLVLAQVGTFVEGMSAGRGFIAIAVVALGRWSPSGVGLAALVFGAMSALQFVLQSVGWALPYQLFLAVPYAMTLLALAGVAGRHSVPAALGQRPEP
jgi:ABC-type uncharacterized transport system permease subunit